MPITVSHTEYAKIHKTPYHFLVRDVWYTNTSAGDMVRDLIERFVTPKCYLVIPGNIQPGRVFSFGTKEHPISWRTVGDCIDHLAEMSDYTWSVGADGRISFVPATADELSERAHRYLFIFSGHMRIPPDLEQRFIAGWRGIAAP